jgi:hypothetical protein
MKMNPVDPPLSQAVADPGAAGGPGMVVFALGGIH